MKILIILGMVIIFISAFFIMFIFDTVIKKQVGCMQTPESGCNAKEMGQSLILGISLVTMFLIIDSGVMYMIIKSITSSGSSYIAYSV